MCNQRLTRHSRKYCITALAVVRRISSQETLCGLTARRKGFIYWRMQDKLNKARGGTKSHPFFLFINVIVMIKNDISNYFPVSDVFFFFFLIADPPKSRTPAHVQKHLTRHIPWCRLIAHITSSAHFRYFTGILPSLISA